MNTQEFCTKFFAPVTAKLDAIYLKVSRKAEHLHRLLLRSKPAGEEILCFAKQLAATMKVTADYIRKCLRQLAQAGLIEIRGHEYGGIYTLVAFNKRDNLSRSRDDLSRSRDDLSRFHASNGANTLDRSREHREQQHAAAAAVGVATQSEGLPIGNEQRVNLKISDGSMAPTFQTSDSEDRTTEEMKLALQEAESAIYPEALNPQLKGFLLQYSAAQIIAAAQCVRENRAKNNVQKPAGMLRVAIKQGWKPVAAQTGEKFTLPKPVSEWVDRARQSGIVLATRLHEGILLALRPNDQYQPVDELMEAYPPTDPTW